MQCFWHRAPVLIAEASPALDPIDFLRPPSSPRAILLHQDNLLPKRDREEDPKKFGRPRFFNDLLPFEELIAWLKRAA